MADIKVRSVADTTDRWEKNTTGASKWYEDGVKNPRQNPTEAAVRHAEDWQARVSSSDTFDKWKANTGATSLSDWQEPTLELGPSRFRKGVTFSKKKYEKFYSKFKPMLESVVSKVAGMPGRTLEDRIDRSVTLQRELAEFSYRGR